MGFDFHAFFSYDSCVNHNIPQHHTVFPNNAVEEVMDVLATQFVKVTTRTKNNLPQPSLPASEQQNAHNHTNTNRASYDDSNPIVSICSANVVDSICGALNASAVVVIFLTQNYMRMVEQSDRGDDLCRVEFNYIMQRRSAEHVIVAAMDESVQHPSSWTGPIASVLGGCAHLDFTNGVTEPLVTNLCDLIMQTIQATAPAPSTQPPIVHHSPLSPSSSSDPIMEPDRHNDPRAPSRSAAGTPHTILFTNTKYVGVILSGTVEHGFGEFRCLEGKAKGNRYVGEFSGTIPDGPGRFTFADGEVYEGEYHNGRKNGHGTYYFNSGARYTGGYSEGKKDGFGTYKSKDGDVYEGEYQVGKKHGKGTMRYATGDIYSGSYKEDKKHGNGRYQFKDGGVYEGEYVSDKKHGFGKYTWPNGDVYIGEYRDGKKHGMGKLTYENGRMQQGKWVNGDFKS